jgi:hypothetical protein
MSGTNEEWTAPLPEIVASKGYVMSEKVAATLLAWSMVTVQPATPLQAPDQPRNIHPGFAAGVRVTMSPLLYD